MMLKWEEHTIRSMNGSYLLSKCDFIVFTITKDINKKYILFIEDDLIEGSASSKEYVNLGAAKTAARIYIKKRVKYFEKQIIKLMEFL